jgi:hypothetical protein
MERRLARTTLYLPKCASSCFRSSVRSMQGSNSELKLAHSCIFWKASTTDLMREVRTLHSPVHGPNRYYLPVGDAVTRPTATWTMIHSSEFHELRPSERFFSLARAYLEASTVLCEAMVYAKCRPRLSNSRVILHLCHHAFELFLKAFIMNKMDGASLHTHSLYDLYEKYQKIFGGPQFQFSMPFGLEATPPFEPSPEMAMKYFGQLDQRYRYTLDRSLIAFPEIEGFLPNSFHAQLQDHSREFDRLIPLITTCTAAPGSAERDPFV